MTSLGADKRSTATYANSCPGYTLENPVSRAESSKSALARSQRAISRPASQVERDQIESLHLHDHEACENSRCNRLRFSSILERR